WNRGWTEDEDQRRGGMHGRGAYGIEKLRCLSSRPIVEANQDYVDAAGIAGEQSGGIEQFLKDLVVGGEAEFAGESQFAHPKGQGGLDGFRNKSGADRNRQIPLYWSIIYWSIHGIA